jgi:hypothetical protein
VQDPLSVLPIVLPCFDPVAKDIIKLIAEHASPREVIIAVQEAVECIEHAFSSAEEDPDEDNAQEYFVHQLGILTTVYSIGASAPVRLFETHWINVASFSNTPDSTPKETAIRNHRSSYP